MASTKERYEELVANGKADRLVYQSLGPSYACTRYRIIDNPDNLEVYDMVAICDKGNYNFGYDLFGSTLTIYTD